jgi:cytochrome c biogenesis protein CcmG/thiol:disulfide interchange protein DsbE
MKTSVTLALIGVFILGTGGLYYYLSSGNAAGGITVGDDALNIKFTAIDGSTFDLREQKGKVVVIDFITTSCPVCVDEFDILRQIAGDERVALVSVNLDSTSISDLQRFSTYYTLEWMIGFSKQAGIDYKVNAVPTILIIDKEGVIRYRGYYTELSQLQQMINEYA